MSLRENNRTHAEVFLAITCKKKFKKNNSAKNNFKISILFLYVYTLYNVH